MERSHRCGTFITCITLSVVEKSHRWCCGVFIFLFDLFAADDLVDIMKCKYSKYFIKKLLIYGFVFHWFTWNILLISSYTVWTAINCSQWVLLLLFVVHPLILSSTQFLQDWTGLSPYHFVFSFFLKINSSVCGKEELTGGGLVCCLHQRSCSTLGPVNTSMGKCLRYVTNHLGQLSLPSLLGKYIEYLSGRG